MNPFYKRGKGGFTLIELLVVIAIIGILSSVVLVSLNSARRKARDARRISDLRAVQTALQLYSDANGGYPKKEDWAKLMTDLSKTDGTGYLSSAAADPTNSGLYVYKYAHSNGTAFHISATLEEYNQALKNDSDFISFGVTGWVGQTANNSTPVNDTERVYDLYGAY